LTESFDLALPASTASWNEADEVRLAKARDADIWSLWYNRYFPTLYRYALARVGRREDAEDIASQTFIKAVEGIGRYTYQGRPVLAWLYRIAHNLVADRLRQERRRPSVSIESAGIDVETFEAGIPNIELVDIINRLKDDQRDVLVLRYMLSLDTPEIATLLGKTESAVYSLQSRAVVNLRMMLR
jgi:RNA polymerase sigma-70 factor (ECF subfamily)